MSPPIPALPLADDLAPPALANPVWQSLHGPHHHLGRFTELACRYNADVSPFAALAQPTPQAFAQLATLLSPGEHIWLIDPTPPPPTLFTIAQLLPGLQMILPIDAAIPDSEHDVATLAAPDLPDMLALITLAYPGFFLPGTPRMGEWFGIRVAGQLVAMVGERFLPSGRPEISGLCTHPDHRGQGYAATLLHHLTRRHRTRNLRSWLAVSASNTRAIALYQQLNFRTVARVSFQRLHHIA